MLYFDRLEQEVEEAKKQQEQVFADELLRHQSRAENRLQQVRSEADAMLVEQRSKYEGRLHELEHLLVRIHFAFRTKPSRWSHI